MKRGNVELNNDMEIVRAPVPDDEGASGGKTDKDKTGNVDERQRECAICYDSLDATNQIKYKKEGSDWFDANFCSTCILYMRDTQYSNYIEKVRTTDCKSELTRLLEQGPPIWLFDSKMFPEVSESEHVSELQYDGTVVSAKLIGAMEGDERTKVLEELRQLRAPSF